MIETVSLFRPLDKKLISLLRSLSASSWETKTVAGKWTVKDVAAHLLDGSIRTISMYRDHSGLRPTEELKSYPDIVKYLDRLNAEWVQAMARVSPALLMDWLETTHEHFVVSLEKLDPYANAKFSVAWAGETISTNWFHVAREFTEKWHHQQQIRDAVNQPGILTKEFYPPVLETFMRALPHRYKDTHAPKGTCLSITIDSEAGGTWLLEKEEHGWKLAHQVNQPVNAKVIIPANVSWKLFTKAVQFQEVESMIKIEGEKQWVMPALQMITVMA